MSGNLIKLNTITGRINARAIELLEAHPEGVRWMDLLKALEKSNPSWHPKTINGCVWKLTEKYPDQIYKPEKGLFKLVKYRH